MSEYYDRFNTPRQRCENDPAYRQLVQFLEDQIHQANYTPSELREAVILACINYEQRNVRNNTIIQGSEAIDRLTNKSKQGSS